MSDDPRAGILEILAADKWLAHFNLFAHRHMHNGQPVPPAEFHPDLVADFWSREPYSIRMAFRGSAKSTIGEEDIVLAACLEITATCFQSTRCRSWSRASSETRLGAATS